jgi:hypothetical protein
VPRWIRFHDPDEHATGYVELGDDGWALRHVEVRGPDRRPATAETLAEVLRIRDHCSPAEMREYERRYGHGCVAEGDLSDVELSDLVVEISEAEFERVWGPARAALDGRA